MVILSFRQVPMKTSTTRLAIAGRDYYTTENVMHRATQKSVIGMETIADVRFRDVAIRSIVISDFCAPGCVSAWQGDGECDSACFNEACGYDKGDCGECSPGCRPDRIGNGICDGDCMTDACHWDMGDCAGVCKVYPVDYNELPFEYNQCRTEWEGDGYCDCFCMNEECDYDKGDCKGKESECADKIAAAQSRRGGIYPTPIPGSAQDLARRQSTTTTTTTPLLIGSRDQGSVEVPTASSSDTSVAALLASDAVSE
eukprot:Blabericola_migrator_1__12788@NODE_821_length_6384_cov_57_760329_g579_i0_p5_GENE_NODE_821_length_6384_cov_57_760329_g579_i0NODE_821_length_6384_cov_57_760329_g579_i0_p5_ORF_typecomplete_len256_score9_23Notch/PF00066_17/3_9e09Notch/PF00066_17/1_1e07Notch/PF00066_17/2_7e06_NODE_821_length_6384_cov_57_760329_g579_i030433810